MKCFNGITKSSERASDLSVTAFVHADDPVLFITFYESLELEFADAIFEGDADIADHLSMERFQVL